MRTLLLLSLLPAVAAAQSLTGRGPLTNFTKSRAPSAVTVVDTVWVFDQDEQGRLRACENGGNCRIIDTPAIGSRYSGACTAAAQYDGVPHVFYVEQLQDGRERLRHAAQSLTNPAIFTVELLDGAGGFGGRTTNSVGGCPSALAFNGLLFLAYQDKTGGDLRLGRFDGFSWLFETHDGDRYDSAGRTYAYVGATSTFAQLGNELFLYYPGDYGLREAVLNGNNNTWRFSIVDGTVGPFASVKAVTFGPSVRVFYAISSSGWFSPLILRQGTRAYSPKTGQWYFSITTVDSSESVGRDVDAAVIGGVLHVVYYAETNGNLRHAFTTNGLWTLETVDGHVNDGFAMGRVNGNVGRHPVVVAAPFPLAIYEDIGAGILRQAF